MQWLAYSHALIQTPTLMCLLRLELWLKHLPQTVHLWGRCFSWTCRMWILSRSLFSNDLLDITSNVFGTLHVIPHWTWDGHQIWRYVISSWHNLIWHRTWHGTWHGTWQVNRFTLALLSIIFPYSLRCGYLSTLQNVRITYIYMYSRWLVSSHTYREQSVQGNFLSPWSTQRVYLRCLSL